MADQILHELRASFCFSISNLNGVINLKEFHMHEAKEWNAKYKFFNIYYRTEPTFHENPDLLVVDYGFQEDEIWSNINYNRDDVISQDYTHLVSFWAPREFTLFDIYLVMQGETWSPEGEARELILRSGLKHTSMSVGDLIEDPETGTIYEVAASGFNTYC
jgi:hypothetical protein